MEDGDDDDDDDAVVGRRRRDSRELAVLWSQWCVPHLLVR